MSASFTLSAFGDEIAADLATQLEVLARDHVRFLELRGAWDSNVLELGRARLREAKQLLDEAGFGVSAIGSPIGKSELERDESYELLRLERAIEAAEVLATPLIRIFSFWVPAGETAAARDSVLRRLSLLAERATAAGVTLVHENERGIYGDTPERCLDLLQSVGSPALRMAFDPANFVQVGFRPMTDAWPLLADYVVHVHIKDAVFADGSIRPAGEGDGQLPHLLAALEQRDYDGFLTLEPHLKIAGSSGGHSGADGMHTAVVALRTLLSELGGAAGVA